jgi:hypothetical protein
MVITTTSPEPNKPDPANAASNVLLELLMSHPRLPHGGKEPFLEVPANAEMRSGLKHGNAIAAAQAHQLLQRFEVEQVRAMDPDEARWPELLFERGNRVPHHVSL